MRQAGLNSSLCKELIERSRNPKSNVRVSEDLEEDDEIGPGLVKGSGSGNGKDEEIGKAQKETAESPIPRAQETASPGKQLNFRHFFWIFFTPKFLHFSTT